MRFLALFSLYALFFIIPAIYGAVVPVQRCDAFNPCRIVPWARNVTTAPLDFQSATLGELSDTPVSVLFTFNNGTAQEFRTPCIWITISIFCSEIPSGVFVNAFEIFAAAVDDPNAETADFSGTTPQLVAYGIPPVASITVSGPSDNVLDYSSIIFNVDLEQPLGANIPANETRRLFLIKSDAGDQTECTHVWAATNPSVIVNCSALPTPPFTTIKSFRISMFIIDEGYKFATPLSFYAPSTLTQFNSLCDWSAAEPAGCVQDAESLGQSEFTIRISGVDLRAQMTLQSFFIDFPNVGGFNKSSYDCSSSWSVENPTTIACRVSTTFQSQLQTYFNALNGSAEDKSTILLATANMTVTGVVSTSEVRFVVRSSSVQITYRDANGLTKLVSRPTSQPVPIFINRRITSATVVLTYQSSGAVVPASCSVFNTPNWITSIGCNLGSGVSGAIGERILARATIAGGQETNTVAVAVIVAAPVVTPCQFCLFSSSEPVQITAELPAGSYPASVNVAGSLTYRAIGGQQTSQSFNRPGTVSGTSIRIDTDLLPPSDPTYAFSTIFATLTYNEVSSVSERVGVVRGDVFFTRPLGWTESYVENLNTNGGFVSLTGSGLATMTSVKIGNYNCTSPTVSDTAVSCTLPANNGFLREGSNFVSFSNAFNYTATFRIFEFANITETPNTRYIATNCLGACSRTISIRATAFSLLQESRLRGVTIGTSVANATHIDLLVTSSLPAGPLNATLILEDATEPVELNLGEVVQLSSLPFLSENSTAIYAASLTGSSIILAENFANVNLDGVTIELARALRIQDPLVNAETRYVCPSLIIDAAGRLRCPITNSAWAQSLVADGVTRIWQTINFTTPGDIETFNSPLSIYPLSPSISITSVQVLNNTVLAVAFPCSTVASSKSSGVSVVVRQADDSTLTLPLTFSSGICNFTLPARAPVGALRVESFIMSGGSQFVLPQPVQVATIVTPLRVLFFTLQGDTTWTPSATNAVKVRLQNLWASSLPSFDLFLIGSTLLTKRAVMDYNFRIEFYNANGVNVYDSVIASPAAFTNAVQSASGLTLSSFNGSPTVSPPAAAPVNSGDTPTPASTSTPSGAPRAIGAPFTGATEGSRGITAGEGVGIAVAVILVVAAIIFAVIIILRRRKGPSAGSTAAIARARQQRNDKVLGVWEGGDDEAAQELDGAQEPGELRVTTLEGPEAVSAVIRPEAAGEFDSEEESSSNSESASASESSASSGADDAEFNSESSSA